jgi:hypothetical protein
MGFFTQKIQRAQHVAKDFTDEVCGKLQVGQIATEIFHAHWEDLVSETDIFSVGPGDFKIVKEF